MMHFLDVKTQSCEASQKGDGNGHSGAEFLLELFPISLSCLQLRPKSRVRSGEKATAEESKQEELQMKAQVFSLPCPRSWPSVMQAVRSPDLQANLCSLLLQTLTPLATPMAAGTTAMAFCPFPLCGSFGSFGSGLESCAPPLPELSLQALQRGLLVATFLQGSLGLLRICLGDFFSGSYTLLLATLGYNSRHPGPSSAWLKTYVLISFINGTMGHIDLMQNTLLHNFPALQMSLPLSVNLMHTVQLLVPGCSYCGAYFGWQHLKAQRKMMLEAYQREWMMMMERPPWPPPPLIPLPQLPGAQGAQVPMPPGPAPIAPMAPVKEPSVQ
mmetsp:Transcript_47785/g.58736  ORF Transcript_47785/g.58736 Transcript_47785/m.58736 type:complete len:328 (-) Transcript_47785:30-1013(-)